MKYTDVIIMSALYLVMVFVALGLAVKAHAAEVVTEYNYTRSYVTPSGGLCTETATAQGTYSALHCFLEEFEGADLIKTGDTLVPGALPICTVSPEMGDLVQVEGYPGGFGGERMLTTQYPVILETDGRVMLEGVVMEGMSGGSAIYVAEQCVLGVITNQGVNETGYPLVFVQRIL